MPLYSLQRAVHMKLSQVYLMEGAHLHSGGLGYLPRIGLSTVPPRPAHHSRVRVEQSALGFYIEPTFMININIESG